MDSRAQAQMRLIRDVSATLRAGAMSAWLFGGWGLDARSGRVSREHGDVEFWVDRSDGPRSRNVLLQAGAAILPTQPAEESCEFTWRGVTFSTAYFDRQLDGTFTTRGRWSDWVFPSDSFGDEPCVLDGVPVLVMSTEGMLAMKEQYPKLRNGSPWRDKDAKDVAALRTLSAKSDNEAPRGTVIIVSGAPGVGKSSVSLLVAAAFDQSVRLQTDDLMASVVSGWIDPNLPEAEQQNEAVGAALAMSAMSFAADRYTTVIDGHIFPEGAEGLARACAARGLVCHYVVLTADLATCWARASHRDEWRWTLEYAPFAALHGRFDDLDLDARHLVDALGSPESTCEAVLSAFRAGRLAM